MYPDPLDTLDLVDVKYKWTAKVTNKNCFDSECTIESTTSFQNTSNTIDEVSIKTEAPLRETDKWFSVTTK